MADLYFKVSSDWQEVVRLREEINRLENQLNQFNGKAPLEVLDKLGHRKAVSPCRSISVKSCVGCNS